MNIFKLVIRKQVSLIFLFLAVPLLAFAGVEIDITLTPVGSFVAKTEKLSGTAQKKGDLFSAKDLKIKIDDLNSGIELRDAHMKENYFETKKFPIAVLKSAKGKNGKFVGLLNLHGVDKKVSGTFEVNSSQIDATFKTRMSDFKIKKATYMGVGVKDEVTVKVKLPFTESK